MTTHDINTSEQSPQATYVLAELFETSPRPIDTSVSLQETSRRCPTTLLTGWLELYYAPQTPKVINVDT